MLSAHSFHCATQGIERKIRGVQKKLRRVQQIEEQAANGQVLDAGQQALRGSKLALQSSLQQLLEQWAVLEPVLIEQQAQRMLAIADSECAVCLDEYDSERPPIRTSCCGELAVLHRARAWTIAMCICGGRTMRFSGI